MATLVTGGSGKTAGELARILYQNGKPFVVASRKGTSSNPSYKAVKFDWFDPSTFENPFKEVSNIENMYLVAPPVLESFPVAKPFINLAVQKGVKKIVYLSASDIEKSDSFLGATHSYLDSLDIFYVALRPTWFIRKSNMHT
jgi:festuclavine dehydrogenase